MAFIDYEAEEMIPPDDRVPDQDNILRVHSVHSRTMRLHYDLYKQLSPRERQANRCSAFCNTVKSVKSWWW